VELDLQHRKVLDAFLDVALQNNATLRLYEREIVAAFEAMTAEQGREIREFQKQPEHGQKA
jgi:hypothetical protein